MGLVAGFLRKNKSGKRSQVKSYSRKKVLAIGASTIGLLGLGAAGVLGYKKLKGKKLLSKAIDNKKSLIKTTDLTKVENNSRDLTKSKTFRPEDISNNGKATPVYRKLPNEIERFAIDNQFRDYKLNKTVQQINQLYRQGLSRDQAARTNKAARKAIKRLKGSR